MSSFLCFICHNTVNSDINEDTREKYREIVGMNLCPDSHLCYICCHMLNKLWLFKSICLKRSLEYPVLFSEKVTPNLQRNEIETITLCTEETCLSNFTQNFIDNQDQSIDSNDYLKLEKERPEAVTTESVDINTDVPTNTGKDLANTKQDFNKENTLFEITEKVFESVDCDACSNDGDMYDFDSNKNQICDVFGIDQIQRDEPKNLDNFFEIEVNRSSGIFDTEQNQTENEPETVQINTETKDTNVFETEQSQRENSKNLSGDIFDTAQIQSETELNNSQCDYRQTDELDNQDCDVFEANQIHGEEEPNYECYDEERNECLNEIRNEETAEELDTPKKKGKSKKSKEKKDFEKIRLSWEEQKSELEAQRRNKKYLEAEFKCHNCAMSFLFKDSYQAHMMRHEESNGEYLCVLCSLRFATGAVLRAHAALHAVRYRCSRCASIIRARHTHTHARHCHDKACSATCHLCGRVFQDGSGLQQHLKRFHMTKTTNRTYSCSVCGKTYSNQAAVRTHMIKHIHRKFSCDQCAATFSSPYTLTQHKKKHSDTEAKQHYCEACGLSYASRKSLLAHYRTSVNHQQRAYECPVCNRSCPNERALSSHMATVHSATKAFACPTCTARYSSRKSLVRHIRSHTTVPQPKLAICHICGNSFKGENKLNRHLREVCEKDKLEEELSSYYEQNAI